jgi:DNA-binding beta-propeller fold protein YncE
MRKLATLTTAFGLLLLPGGCGTPPPASVPQEPPAASRVWPAPPAQPRIRWARSVSGPGDWGIARTVLRRMMDALVGRGAEHFVRPTGVAERDGVLYVADPGAQALWILDAPRSRFAKVGRILDEALSSPVAVAVRPDGAVFVADTGLKKVFLVDREGKAIRVAAQEGLLRPAGLAYDADTGRLYIADSAAHRIGVYGADGALIRSWGRGGSRDGEFNRPTHLSLDRTGTLLVTDALNFRIQAFDREGRFLWKLGHAGDGSGDFAAPKGLAADGAGRVYVVDALFDAVQIFDRDASLLLAFGERGTQAGQFSLPGGVFIGPQDTIYVADAYNQRVQVFLPAADQGKEATR